MLRLHEHRITHRGLTADQLQVTSDGGVMLLGLGNGDVAATDLQIRLDHAQLIAELAVLVGPDRSVELAREKLGAAELTAVVPLLQPVAMHRTTRKALQRDRDILPAVRRQLLGTEEPDEVSPAQLERIRPRALVTLIAGVAAVYLLASQLAEVDVVELLRSADWRWTLAALILSASTYIGAAYSLSGFVLERLRTVYTFLVQVAGSFVTLVTPPAVGGVALNIRYLRRSGVSAADSAASVGVTQSVAFALHAAMLVIVAAITGTSSGHSLRPPTWALYLIAAGLAMLLVIIAIPAGRRLLWARAAPMLGEVIPRLLDVAQQPVKLAQGLGGAFLLTAAYILCLDASIRALGGAVPLASVALVYLTGNAIGSLMPTPGGLGAVEAALSAGLTGRPARRDRDQRGAAVPHADVLAAGPGRLGRARLPAAQERALTGPTGGHRGRANPAWSPPGRWPAARWPRSARAARTPAGPGGRPGRWLRRARRPSSSCPRRARTAGGSCGPGCSGCAARRTARRPRPRPAPGRPRATRRSARRSRSAGGTPPRTRRSRGHCG